MKEELITFKTAELAKQKGFNWNCFGNYHLGRINGKNYVAQVQMYEHDWNNYLEPHRVGYQGNKPDQGQLTTSAPTQSLLQKYLREEHQIHIYIIPLSINNFEYYYFQGGGCTYSKHDNYKTYEDALEQALIEGLNLIK